MERRPGEGVVSKGNEGQRTEQSIAASLRPLPFLLFFKQVWVRETGALALLFAFALVLCWPVTMGNVPVASNTLALWPPWSQLPHEPISNSAIADSSILYLSWNVFERNAIQDGEWPQWDPYTFSGTPFAANSQNQLYYPLTWLLWLLPLSSAIRALTVFNIWFAAAGMYFLCRHFKLSVPGALVPALGFAGSGILQLALEFPGHATPYGWLPWMLLALDNALNRKSAAWTALAALACGLQLVSGNLQWCIYSYFALSCWAVWRFSLSLAKEGLRASAAIVLRAGVVLAGGLVLAAVHLAPLIELNGLATRGTGRISSHSGPLSALLRLLMPEFFGTSVGDVGAPLVFNDLWCVGVGVLLLAMLSLLLFPGRPERWLWASLALFAVLVTYGIGPFLYVRWLPGLSSLLPARIGYLFVFSICLLAGYGVDSWLRACRATPGRAHFSLGAALAIVGGILLLAPLAARDGGAISAALGALQADQLRRAWVMLVAFGVLLGIYCLVSSRARTTQSKQQFKPVPRSILITALVIVVAGDLATAVPGYNAYVPPDQVVPDSPATNWLRQHAGLGRTMALGVNDQPPTLVPNVQLLYSFYSVSGYDSLHTARYEEYWSAVDPTVRPGGSSTPYGNVFIRPQAYSSTLASLLSVRFVASLAQLPNPAGLTQVYSGEVTIYENEAALPRAFIVGGSAVVQHDRLLAQLTAPSFDPTKEILFEEGSAPPTEAVNPGPQGSVGSVAITSYRRNNVTLAADMTAYGWLVLADPNYPGWTAKVDGGDARVYTADYLLRAVPLGVGHHSVTFNFTPTNFRLSLVVSLVTIVALLSTLGVAGYRYCFRRKAWKEKSA